MRDATNHRSVPALRPLRSGHAALLHDVLSGLSRRPKRIPCKYLYDRRGSALFEMITRQPEYYLTRAESAILSRHADEIAGAAGEGCTIVELGAGDSEKSLLLVAALRRPRAYFALDIDEAALARGAERLRRHRPELPLEGLHVDFTRVAELPPEVPRDRRLGYLAGSTIGNYEPAEACDLLRGLRRLLHEDGMLVAGVDLVKPLHLLLPAYDDAVGVTAAFNLNLLERLNRELEADFDVAQFYHRARFDATKSRIEMHAVSRRAQTVTIAEVPFTFAAGEYIHTENCHKYRLGEFHLLARAGGWEPTASWVDETQAYAVVFLRAARA